MPARYRAALQGGLAALALLAVSACTTASTPYQPLSASSRVSGGYSDTRLGEGQYQVTFAGNALTSREKVESYLLFRAAELTLEQHYDWFVIVDRQVERQVRPDLLYDPWFARDYYYWRPYWRYYEPRIGWRSWYPYYGDPFWNDGRDVRTVERYEATAEIRMGHGAMPATDVKAFDARDVVDQVGPYVEYPGE